MELNNINELSPLQRSALVIEGLKGKINILEASITEPIAIIGMSCRFPGESTNPEKYWHLLSNGIDAITQIPGNRWDLDKYYDSNPEVPGKMYSKKGGFLSDIEQFDPHFFGISPREAISIDPQHRLLLEVSWEALVNAGYNIKELRGSQTGVFMGITLNDYEKIIKDSQIDYNIEPYALTGLPLNASVGRISYTYGFTGPSLAIDTACSSSLVAIHQACQSLRQNECQMALAGGVNLILTPDSMISTSKAKLLSADGQCKTFDEKADGIGRAEGCGVIVLKRLSDAVDAGDNILATVRSSSINQDGASSGFTAPNSSSQQSLIQQALTIGKLKPSDISYLEAHGTGTALGDTIELRSLAKVFGEGTQRKHALKIGSVKTNIGHAESASGIASVIKVILQLQHKQISPHLHFHNPTSKFSWDEFSVEIPTKLMDWESNGSPRIAGVSSFGASGTNGHIILEEAPKINQIKKDKRKKTAQPESPFQRETYWVDTKKNGNNGSNLSNIKNQHSFIGQRTHKYGSRDIYFQSEWNSITPAYVVDHIIFDKIVVAGASHISMLLSAFKEISTDEIYHLEDIYFTEALVLTEKHKRIVQVVLDSHTKKSVAFKIHSFNSGPNVQRSDDRTSHVIGKMHFGSIKESSENQVLLKPEQVKGRCAKTILGEEFYNAMWRADYHLGSSFRWIKQIWHTKGEAICKMEIPQLRDNLEDYELYPGLIDSCFQIIGATGEQNQLEKMEKEDYIFVPFHIESFQLYKRPTEETLWCYCTINEERSNEGVLAGDICLINNAGEKLAEIIGFETRKAPKEILLRNLNTEQDNKFYEINWKQKTLQLNPEPVIEKAKWLLFSTNMEFQDKFGNSLLYKDQECILISKGTEYLKIDDRHYQIDYTHKGQIEKLLEGNPDINGVVLFLGVNQKFKPLDFEGIQKAQDMCCATLNITQAILALNIKKVPSISIITQGTQNVTSVDDVVSPQYATLWGFGKVVSLEHPELNCQLIDLDTKTNETELVSLLHNELLNSDKEDQLAIREGIRFVPRLIRTKLETIKPNNKVSIQANANYLITGGLGDLGLEIAKWLVEQGVTSLILTSRSAPSEKAKKIIKIIEEKGVSVNAVQSDISNEKQLKTLIAKTEKSSSPIKGIINAAGVLNDAPINQMDQASFLKVMDSKVVGTWNLHQQTEHLELDFFVCFSSMASFIGTPYQSNYAAANAFMDALVAYRRTNGLPGLSINWGPWNKIGMAARLDRKYKEYAKENGIYSIDPTIGIRGLATLLGAAKTNIGFLDVDWNKYAATLGKKSSLLKDFFIESSNESVESKTYINKLIESPKDERIGIIMEIITNEMANILGEDNSKLDVNEPLSMIGIDSLMAMEVRTIIQKKLNVDIPVSKLLEGGNILELSGTINSSLSEWILDSNISSGNSIQEEISTNDEAFIEGEL